MLSLGSSSDGIRCCVLVNDKINYAELQLPKTVGCCSNSVSIKWAALAPFFPGWTLLSGHSLSLLPHSLRGHIVNESRARDKHKDRVFLFEMILAKQGMAYSVGIAGVAVEFLKRGKKRAV